ncbi:MAG: DUF308 domain-containing protein [Lachnospiraceae bacterium]|nr:DUF308 domain-containing protein [Lachnospiraceae bacterium]
MGIKRNKIIMGIMFLLVGILFLAAPSTTTKVIYSVIGVVFVLAGVIRLISILRAKGDMKGKIFQIVLSAIVIALGVFFLINPEFLVTYSYIVFGFVVILNGAANFLNLLRGGGGKSKFLTLIVSLVLIIVGVLILVHPFVAAEMVTTLIGVALIIVGVINLIYGLTIKDTISKVEE